MNKKLLITAATIFLIGSILFGLGFILEPNFNFTGSSSTIIENKKLEGFNNIDIEIIAADIEIKYGDDYQLDYSLSEKETIKRFEVIDHTLYFKTATAHFWGASFTDSYLVLTIPYGTQIEDIKLKTVSGDIDINGVDANSLKLKATSGDLDIVGNYGTMDLKLTSGDINFNGLIKDSANIDATSSDIELNIAQDIEIEVDGFASVEWNDNDRGRNFYKAGTEGKLHIKNTAGDIELNTR